MLQEIRRERGEYCECCGAAARHGHHIIPVSDTGIASALLCEKSNIMLLCDDCHGLMHPLIRRVNDWEIARRDRGQATIRRS